MVKEMKYRSVFDIIGPVMIDRPVHIRLEQLGLEEPPSSIWQRAKVCECPLVWFICKTYKGHGTDVAIIGGLLDYDTYDERIRDALKQLEKWHEGAFYEEEAHTDHPEYGTSKIGDDDGELELVGISIGGVKRKLPN